MVSSLADFVFKSLPASSVAELPHYGEALRHACEASRAPYALAEFGRRFRLLAHDPSWFATLLVSDANLEGYSAQQLWIWAESISDVPVREAVQSHALDEARHSRMFANLVGTLFPDVLTPDFTERLAAMSPNLSAKRREPLQLGPIDLSDDVLRSLAFVNTFETKALVLGRLLKPVLVAYASPNDAARVAQVSDALLADEVRHIEYTARIIERASEQGRTDFVDAALRAAHASLNASTSAELEQI